MSDRRGSSGRVSVPHRDCFSALARLHVLSNRGGGNHWLNTSLQKDYHSSLDSDKFPAGLSGYLRKCTTDLLRHAKSDSFFLSALLHCDQNSWITKASVNILRGQWSRHDTKGDDFLRVTRTYIAGSRTLPGPEPLEAEGSMRARGTPLQLGDFIVSTGKMRPRGCAKPLKSRQNDRDTHRVPQTHRSCRTRDWPWPPEPSPQRQDGFTEFVDRDGVSWWWNERKAELLYGNAPEMSQD